MRATQRATAGSRVGIVPLRVCRTSSLKLLEGGPVSKVRQVSDSLPHAFSFDPAMPGRNGVAATVLIEMIEAAIAAWV